MPLFNKKLPQARRRLLRLLPALQRVVRSDSRRNPCVICQDTSKAQNSPSSSKPKDFLSLRFLIIIANTAAQLADLRYEAYFRKRRRGGARLWKQVGPRFSDLAFRLLRGSENFFTISPAVGVLKGSKIRACWNSLRTDEELP